MDKAKFNVTGMSCSACSSRVEKAVSKLDGIEEVSVNLLTGTMNASFDESKLSAGDICQAVDEAGYGASVINKGGEEAPKGQDKAQASDSALKETEKMKKRLIWSVVFLVPLMGVSMGPMLFGIHGGGNHPLTSVIIQLMLLGPIVFLNRKYFVNGIPSLFRGGANMDSLVAIGSLASMAYGCFALLKMAYGYETGNMEIVHNYSSQIYIESAGTILTLITVGKYLETKSKGKTSQVIEKLMNLAPKTSVVIRDGKEEVVPTESLKVGDIVLVKPGETLAADGEIVEGETSLDESAITGESVPVDKKAGDKVVSASINGSGTIKVRCEKTGEDSTLSQVIALVEEASSSKAPIAKLADKIAGVFVPTVMVISLVTCIAWLLAGKGFEFALNMAISVLVISCPCALGLATPVAIMVGTGKGAENGILIKSGEAFQRASEVDVVVMDKTGTITEGKPKVVSLTNSDGAPKELLEVACALEKGSEHPLSKAVIDYCKEQGVDVPMAENFKAEFGKGVRGRYLGEDYIAGNAAILAESGIEAGEAENEFVRLSERGITPIFVASETRKKVLGLIGLADSAKATSADAISEFQRMGIKVHMLTGDNERTAEAVGKAIGVDKTVAGVLPQGKEKYIANLQGEGKKVAMIGDGVNDGPALARADVGIAIGAGTDIAIESADAVLVKSDLLDGVSCVKLSKAVLKNIKENLFWAFFYNIIGIPMAAGVLYPAFGLKLSPMIGSLAMSLSSVCVVTNALRLKKFKPIDDKLQICDKIELTSGAQSNRQDIDGCSSECCAINDTSQEVGACDNSLDNAGGNPDRTQGGKKMKYKLGIEGMMCMHCQQHAKSALAAMKDVVDVDVNLDDKYAIVDTTEEVAEGDFKAVIEEAGYELNAYETL